MPEGRGISEVLMNIKAERARIDKVLDKMDADELRRVWSLINGVLPINANQAVYDSIRHLTMQEMCFLVEDLREDVAQLKKRNSNFDS
jgi:hypothetical protein